MRDLPESLRSVKTFVATLPEFDQCDVGRQVVAGQVSCRRPATYRTALLFVEQLQTRRR